MAVAETDEWRLPPGGRVAIPHRGTTWVWDSGPAPDRPTVLLLHGWTSTAALTWHRCTAPLAARDRVVAPDLRGHGRGIRSRAPFRLEACADDVAALIEHLGCGPVIAAGYSMGGPVAQLLWRRHPDLVAGLVLCATAATFAPPSPVAGVVAATAVGLSVAGSVVPWVLRSAGMRRWAEASDADGRPRRPIWAQEEWGAADPAELLGAGAALLRYDSSAWIGGVDVPTAVVITEEDTTVPTGNQRRLAGLIPDAWTVSVDGTHRAAVEQYRAFVPAFLDACAHVGG